MESEDNPLTEPESTQLEIKDSKKGLSEIEVISKFVEPHIRSIIPEFWDQIPGLILNRGGGVQIVDNLKSILSPEYYKGEVNQSPAHKTWDIIGKVYRGKNLWFDALQIYLAEYDETLKAQLSTGVRFHKGTPLCWLFDVFTQLGYPNTAKRYLMLCLSEDAALGDGYIDKEKTGVYFRLNWLLGMPDHEISRYALEMWRIAESNPENALFPEWVLQNVDNRWNDIYPSTNELGRYYASRTYAVHLLSRLGEKTGKSLELLTDYFFSCIPGCKTTRNETSKSSEYDVICVNEGFFVDFRDIIDRYFVCECKDLHEPVNIGTVLKFSGVLKSIDTNFGVLVSSKGVTGTKSFRAAARELSKIYQREKTVIIVLDKKDLEKIANGENLIGIISTKYKTVRFDL